MSRRDRTGWVDAIQAEAAIARRVVTRQMPAFLESLEMVSGFNLAQVLLALWDSGIYEYVREHAAIDVPRAASELGLEPDVLRQLVEYLVGRGLMRPGQAGFELTERGLPYWNSLTRGLLTSHVGGYTPLLTRLGPLLRKEMGLDDPAVARVSRLVAEGAGQTLTGSGTVPWVMRVLDRLGGRFVLDLGCGAGLFLVQLGLLWPEGKGVGVDMSADAIAGARKLADECGVSERIAFHVTKVTAASLNLAPEVAEQVDVITAMYMLHELGGAGGPDAISEVIAAVRKHFPGRKLLMLEGTRADPMAMWASPPRSFGQLDYSFIHPLSGQGPLRTPEEWQQIIEKAGATLIERVPGFTLVPSWVSLYVVGLD